MNKEQARALLESQKEQMQNDLKKYKEAEEALDESELGANIFGPKNELSYRRMLKNIEESGSEEE